MIHIASAKNSGSRPLVPVETLITTGDATGYYSWRGEMRDSASPYDGFSLCHYTGDDESHYMSCRRALAEMFGCKPDHIVIPRQTHSGNVFFVGDRLPAPVDLDDVDALVTLRHDIIIGVNTADCVPVIFVDGKKGAIAVAHAGWRGALSGIATATVSTMVSHGCDPADIYVAMGPSICPECFEVGNEVASLFPRCCVDSTSHAKPHVSLHDYIVHTLSDSGIPSDNITPFDHALCTKCHPMKFFSARAIGVKSGRMFSFVTFLKRVKV